MSPEAWAGVKDTLEDRDSCTQLVDGKPEVVKGSEDCLYLSVHIPVKVGIS